jgi:predicted peroxiredoxin
VRGLTIIVVEASPERFRAALSIAAAQAALGWRARIFIQGEAVGLLRPPLQSFRDEAHQKAGLPTLAMLFDEALDLGAEVIACQSGLLLCNMEAEELDDRIQFGGLVSILQTTANDRVLCV